MGQCSYDSLSLHRPRIIFSFHFLWLNGSADGSITLIRVETERYDIVRLSKVTTKSLASGEGSLESNKLGEAKLQVNFADFDSGQDFIFFWCENKAKVIRRPCDSTSGNLNKTSVRERSRGVYLAIG